MVLFAWVSIIAGVHAQGPLDPSTPEGGAIQDMLFGRIRQSCLPPLGLTGNPKFMPVPELMSYQYQKELPILESMPKSASTSDRDDYIIDAVPATLNMIGNYQTDVFAYAARGDTPSVPSKTLNLEANKKVVIKFVNKLVDSDGNWIEHPARIDQSIHWANPACDHEKCSDEHYKGPIPMNAHMHGFNTTQESDGHPDAWFLPDAPGIEGEYNRVGPIWEFFKSESEHPEMWDLDSQVSVDYPVRASTRWYHDHTVGMTRNNVFMGLAGFIITRGGDFDAAIDSLTPREKDIELMVMDRSFTTDGQMYWPVRGVDEPRPFLAPKCGEPTCNGLGPSDIPQAWVPAYLGSVNLVNGAAWPKLEVSAGCYRFRILTASDSRIYNYTLDQGVKFNVIGSDNGFVDIFQTTSWILAAPGERFEVLVDFSGLAAGTKVMMNNDAHCGFNTTAGRIMQFVVTNETSDACPTDAELRTIIPSQPAQVLPGFDGPATGTQELVVHQNPSATVVVNNPLFPAPSIKEACDVEVGAEDSPYMFVPGIAFLLGPPEGGLGFAEPTNNYFRLGEIYNWTITNKMESPHPIHIHLGGFEVVKREVLNFTGSIYTDEVVAEVLPMPWERGWVKDTVMAYQGTITHIRTRFTIPGTFVYHCHIITHEDKDMMRPMCILNADGSVPEGCKIRDDTNEEGCHAPKASTAAPASTEAAATTAAPVGNTTAAGGTLADDEAGASFAVVSLVATAVLSLFATR